MPLVPIPALLASVFACGEADPVGVLLACGDAACRSAALRPAWEHDPGRVETWLGSLGDDRDRELLVEQLALSEPSAAARLCRLLPERGRARERCEARVVRPHLDTARRKPLAPEAAPDAAPGPRSGTLSLLALSDPPWFAVPADARAAALDGCEQREPALCARFRARDLALALDRDGAGLACLAGDPDLGNAYAECLFQTAETLAEARGAEGVGVALELCSWSSFGPMCAAHVLTRVGPAVPAADELRAEDLAGPRATVAAIAAATAGQPRLQASYVDRYWSAWTATTCRWARRVDGRLLGMLPEEARHHLAVAVAARLLLDRDPRQVDLEALVAATAAALADPGREPTAAARRKLHPLNTLHARDGWSEDREDQRAIPAAWVMGPGRRALVLEDPAVDLRIAVLEAAFQAGTAPPARFFLDDLAEPGRHRLERWTAARLGAALDPEAAAALHDPDPLVQAALDGPRRAPGPPPAEGGRAARPEPPLESP